MKDKNKKYRNIKGISVELFRSLHPFGFHPYVNSIIEEYKEMYLSDNPGSTIDVIVDDTGGGASFGQIIINSEVVFESDIYGQM
jgi:hypothetical protein